MLQRTKPPLKCPFLEGKACMEKECAMFDENPSESTIPGWCAFLGLSRMTKIEFKLDALASALKSSH